MRGGERGKVEGEGENGDFEERGGEALTGDVWTN